MERYAVIDGDIVVNIAEASAEVAQARGWVAAGSVCIGDRYVDGQFVKAAPAPEPVPQTITPGQGLMALYLAKGITEEQVLAAINGIEDAALRYQVQIAYAKATTWERDSISVRTMTGLIGLNDEEVDNLFRVAVDIAL